MKQTEGIAETFDQYRTYLFSLAYRMLGSATDAEDMVQEAFLRWMQASIQEVQSPRSYLSTVIVRLCINQQNSARAQREVYVGPWLPEPIMTGQQPELTENAILAESLSFAFLVLLERLGALERAVFLLREVFDYSYPEIATIVGKNETNCRQIFRRANQHLEQHRSRYDVSSEQQERITSQFLQTTTEGDMQGLLSMLADDIVLTGDGGGKARTALNPIFSPDKVSRGTFGMMRFMPAGIQADIEEINGQPAVVGYLDSQVWGVVQLAIEDGKIKRIFLTLNPDKLHWLNTTLKDTPEQ